MPRKVKSRRPGKGEPFSEETFKTIERLFKDDLKTIPTFNEEMQEVIKKEMFKMREEFDAHRAELYEKTFGKKQ